MSVKLMNARSPPTVTSSTACAAHNSCLDPASTCRGQTAPTLRRRRSPSSLLRRRVYTPGGDGSSQLTLTGVHWARRPRRLSLPGSTCAGGSGAMLAAAAASCQSRAQVLELRNGGSRVSNTCRPLLTFMPPGCRTSSSQDGSSDVCRSHLAEVRSNSRNSLSQSGVGCLRQTVCAQFGDANCRQTAPVLATNQGSDSIDPDSAERNSADCTVHTPITDKHQVLDAESALNQPANDASEVKQERRRNKLTRRKACYRQKKEGRSRSLTHIDTLEKAMSTGEESEHLSEPETGVECCSAGRCRNHSTVRRRQLAMRSKLVSCENFSVRFDVSERGSHISEDLVPVGRANILREALSASCESRKIDADCVSVYLEGSRTPLPLLTTETHWLAGKQLRVKVRDADHKSPVRCHSHSSGQSSTPVRKSSGNYRGIVNRFISGSGEEQLPSSAPPTATTELCSAVASAAALTSSNDGSLKLAAGRAAAAAAAGGAKQNRWSGIFGSGAVKESMASKMDAMIGYLDTYSRQGIPRPPNFSSFDTDPAEEEELYSLECDWRDVVGDTSQLTALCNQQQSAIWELVQTEAAYIHTLKVINDLFLCCLCNLQSNGILSEVDTGQLFSNIQQIYSASRTFWHRHIMAMLCQSRRTRQPLDIGLMSDGFSQCNDIFRPYTRYCLDQNSIKLYCKSLVRHNTLFNGYLAWCETQRDCNRLRLVDILAKPWQRITKYSLLLKAILKKTESIELQSQITGMIESVDVFVLSVDSCLLSRHEQERVRSISEKIESYDCVDTKDDELEKLMRSHQSFSLLAAVPGCGSLHHRQLVMEGEMKLRDSLCSKVDARCFLFTDMLLLCKPVARKCADRLRVLRPPVAVDRLLASESARDATALHCLCLTEYGSVSAAFTLIAADTIQLKAWLAGIRKTQEVLRQLRLDAGGGGGGAAGVSRGGGGGGGSDEYALRRDAEYGRCYDDDCDELETGCRQLLVSCSCSPRASCRCSRVPSLIHSHSSSMDNSDHQHYHQQQLQRVVQAAGASSSGLRSAGDHFSSEETIVSKHQQHHQHQHQHQQQQHHHHQQQHHHQQHQHQQQQQHGSLSPRLERRANLRSVGSTPNQLCVMSHLSVAGRQSMPNLSDADLTCSAAATCFSSSSYNNNNNDESAPVPSSCPQRRSGASLAALSCHRSAESTCRHRPLIRSRPVTTSPPPPDRAASQPVPAAAAAATAAAAPIEHHETVRQSISDPSEEDAFDQLSDHCDPAAMDQETLKSRRVARVDRADNKRYLTAGVVDDMKREELRDAAIHKRLSWNYGHHSAAAARASSSSMSPHTGKRTSKCLSSESMQSSSGVSSVTSLHLSTTSENETPVHSQSNYDTHMEEDGGDSSSCDVLRCQSAGTSPASRQFAHVSTTYISAADPAPNAKVSYISSGQTGVTIDIADTWLRQCAREPSLPAPAAPGAANTASLGANNGTAPVPTRVQITFDRPAETDDAARPDSGATGRATSGTALQARTTASNTPLASPRSAQAALSHSAGQHSGSAADWQPTAKNSAPLCAPADHSQRGHDERGPAQKSEQKKLAEKLQQLIASKTGKSSDL